MRWPTFTKSTLNTNYSFTARKQDNRPIRILIVIGVLFMIGFLVVYLQPQNRGYSWLFALLTTSVCMKLIRLLHEWYHYWKVVPPTPLAVTRNRTVDVLTTFYPGEPYGMVINTLKAIQAMPYPHTTYLCDEADDPFLQRVCVQMGVKRVTRTDKTAAKAGNINNALRQAKGEICLIIDPDHVPVPDFLDKVLPYFEAPAVGFVQCVQGYYNHKKSLIAFGAAEQTYTFYGPLMTCMGQYGTAQAIGANCTFRRTALDSIGGHADGLSEDMHTAMLLHAKGWKSVYVPLPLSYGLVPATLSAYCKQQLKWARGTLELLLMTYPRLFWKLTSRQRIHYATLPLYYLLGVVQLIDFLIPILSMLWMKLPLRLDLLMFATAFSPLLLTAFLIRQYAQRWLIEKHEVGFHVVGGILASGTWWVYVLGVIYTLFRVPVPYLPTPKNDQPRNNFWLCLPNLLMIGMTMGALSYSIYHYGRFALSNMYSQLMIGFALLNVLILSLNVLIGQETFLLGARQWAAQLSIRKPAFHRLRIALWQTRYGLYGWLRYSALGLFAGLLLLTTGLIAFTYRTKTAHLPIALRYANTQDFYYGTTSASFTNHHQAIGPDSVLVCQHLTWPLQVNKNIQPIHWPISVNQVPMLYIEPAINHSEYTLQSFLQGVVHGKYDGQLVTFIHAINRANRPILLSFAPRFDDPAQPWGTQRESTLLLYKQAWQHVVQVCREQAPLATWLWYPTQPSTITRAYPGEDYIDWIGLSVVNNPSLAPDKRDHSFAALYQPVRTAIRFHVTYSIRQKPVLITQFSSTDTLNQAHQWQTEALDMIQERYPEIRGVVMDQE